MVAEVTSSKNVKATPVHWREAEAMGIRGLLLRKLQVEMLSEEGVTIDPTPDSNGVPITFDREFIYQRLVDFFLKPLGFISPEGAVKEEYLTKVFFPDFLEYAGNLAAQEQDAQIMQICVMASKFNGLSIEENRKLIMQKRS